MYPFASLPENLTAFCAVLRRDYGFRVGLRQLFDAARAIQVSSIADERDVRDALRPVLSSTVEHVLVFDRAFDAFFYPQSTAPEGTAERPEPDVGTPARELARRTAAAHTDRPIEELSSTEASPGTAVEVADADHVESAGLLRLSASPLESEGEPPDLTPVDRLWRDAAAAFVRRVQTAPSRRWRPALRGTRFDLRRTLRSSLHTAGEPVLPAVAGASKAAAQIRRHRRWQPVHVGVHRAGPSNRRGDCERYAERRGVCLLDGARADHGGRAASRGGPASAAAR